MTPRHPGAPRVPFAALAALLPPLLFVALAWPALIENSATYDETDHVPAGYTYVTRGDYRLGGDQPPLVKQLMALPLLGLHPRISAAAEQAFAVALREIDAMWIFGDRLLYQDNQPGPLLFRARAVVLLLGALLVFVVGRWARDLFGASAGLFAATLAALDPNLLAHASVATLDVGFALFFFAALASVRRALRAVTLVNVLVAGGAMGAAFASKHSAPLLVPIVLLLGALRLADPTPWARGRGRSVRTLPGRAALVVLVGLCWALVVWAIIWASYGWRWAGTTEGAGALPIAKWLHDSHEMQVISEFLAAGERLPDGATLQRLAEARPVGLAEQAIGLAARHHLLPEGYLFGLAVLSSVGLIRRSYMLGAITLTGRTAYFPFALLVKTPATTLALVVVALALLVPALARRARAPVLPWRDALCLVVPPAVFLVAAMRSNLNIGYRHVLPIVPFVYAALGWLLPALAARSGRRTSAIVAAAAVLLLAVETLAVRPHFLPFFNVFAGGPRGGLGLLSDSNLDWGQGLPALRRWMVERRVARVNLSYFGTADPHAYGIAFVPILGSYDLTVRGAGSAGYPARAPELPGYVAVGATNLQGTYLFPDSLRDAYAFLRAKQPVAVLAGSIYVYWVERWGE